jgi:transposase-like protein
MMKTRRTYNREFKLEALRLVETTDKSMAQILRRSVV